LGQFPITTQLEAQPTPTPKSTVLLERLELLATQSEMFPKPLATVETNDTATQLVKPDPSTIGLPSEIMVGSSVKVAM
jgi:hypothetical protein